MNDVRYESAGENAEVCSATTKEQAARVIQGGNLDAR